MNEWPPLPDYTHTIDEAKNKALRLFLEIEAELGSKLNLEPEKARAMARRIFAMWGTPPSKRKLATIDSYGLLDRLDMMEPRPNKRRLALELAEETGMDIETTLQQIKRITRLREAELKRGRWFGPITHEHAVRFFGAKSHSKD